MAEYRSKKSFVNQGGIDLKSNDLTRQDIFASESRNAQYRKSGSPEKRKGYQAHAGSYARFGKFTYNRVDENGIEVPEVLGVNESIAKLVASTLTVHYAGAEASAIISIFFDPDEEEYICQIEAGTTVVLTQGLGLGFDEASPYTIDDLRAAIDALADFTATVTGETDVPAAFIPIVRSFDVKAEDFETTAESWVEVNTPVADPLSGSYDHRNDDDFENVSAIQLQNIMYFANGYDHILKYDGQNLYRAGLPSIASLTSAINATGGVTGNNYFHVAQYVQIDHAGNIIEGNTRTVASGINLAGDSADVTVANILEASGFNTNCAIVAGAQVGANEITVDNGSGGNHTMKVGDTAYFFDGVSSAYVEREVTAITLTSITVDGAAVDVADNAVISNNLRIAIYRNETAAVTPDTFFLVAEIPNNSFAATQVYNDNTADASLGAQLISPITDRSPPPAGKYISAFRNQMVIGGIRSAPKDVAYSDVENPEYFPVDSNRFPVDTAFGDNVSGLAQNNELFAIFSRNSIHIVTGNIADGNIRVELLTHDIGCAAHASIAEVKGSLCFLSDRGPYVMTGGQIPVPMGDGRLEPIFDENLLTDDIRLFLFETQVLTDDHRFQLRRAVAINDRKTEKYLLFLPCETTTAGERHANDFSKVINFEYNRNAFLLWDNINAAGGICALNGDLFFSERRYSEFESDVTSICYRRHRLNDSWDYEDNNSAIDWDYTPQWTHLGEPAILKRFTRLKFYNFEETPNNDFMLTVDIEINFVRGVTRGTFTLEQLGGGYGMAAYGAAAYGDPSEPTFKHKLNVGRCRAMRLRFRNSEHQQNVTLPGWEIECVAPFRVGFKS